MFGIHEVFKKNNSFRNSDFISLAKTAQARGIDLSRIIFQAGSDIFVNKRDFGLLALNKEIPNYSKFCFIAGRSWLISSDVLSNQLNEL